MSADAVKLQQELEKKYANYVEATDQAALLLYSKDPLMAREFITDFSVRTAQNTVNLWRELGEYLLVKYIDGNIKKEKNGMFLRNEYGYPANSHFPGYPEDWKRKIVKDTGNKLLVPKN